jgi:ribosomal protein S18 acetylase RimI-like enzyme
MLDLQRQASDAYSTFVFNTDTEADEFWRLLFERGVAEFSPPYGRLVVEDGRTVGMMACLDQQDLRTVRIRSAVELTRAGFFSARRDVERRVRLAGQALMTPQPGDFYLSRLAVAADARSRGVGSRLAAECEAEAASHGCTRLTLDVSADNQLAVRFYEKRGFSRIGLSKVVDQETGRRLEYVHMAKAVA